MQTQDVIKLLDEVLAGLDQAAKQTTSQSAAQPADNVTSAPALAAKAMATVEAEPQTLLPDAIDREIAAAPRQTAITSLRDSAAAEQFRRELETESLTVTTVTSLLQLLKQAVQIFGSLTA